MVMVYILPIYTRIRYTKQLVTYYNNILFIHQRGQLQRRVVGNVHGARVGPALDQQSDHLVFAAQHAQMHGRLPVSIPRIRVGTVVQQHGDDALVAGLRGHVHWVVGRRAAGKVNQVPVSLDRSFYRDVVAALDRFAHVCGRSRRGRSLSVIVYARISHRVKMHM